MAVSGKSILYTLLTFGRALIDSHSADSQLLLIIFIFIVLQSDILNFVQW